MSLGALLGVGLALATTGHAATVSPRWLTAPAVFVHGIALAFWVGSQAPLALAMRGPRQAAIEVLKRFSWVIPFAVAALLASGLLLAVVQLERPDALWTTSYGRVLAIKLMLIALLLAIALWNRLSLTQQAGEGRESLAVSCDGRSLPNWSWWSASSASSDSGIHTSVSRPSRRPTPVYARYTERLMADITVSRGRSGPVSIAIQLRTPDEQMLAAKAVSVTLTSQENGVEASIAEARSSGEGQWQVSMAIPVTGRWTFSHSMC